MLFAPRALRFLRVPFVDRHGTRRQQSLLALQSAPSRMRWDSSFSICRRQAWPYRPPALADNATTSPQANDPTPTTNTPISAVSKRVCLLNPLPGPAKGIGRDALAQIEAVIRRYYGSTDLCGHRTLDRANHHGRAVSPVLSCPTWKTKGSSRRAAWSPSPRPGYAAACPAWPGCATRNS